MKRIQLGLWLAILVSAILTVWLKPGLIRFWPFSLAEFVQLITPLFLVAVFIERALEVFLTAWRGGGSVKISREIEKLKGAIARGNHAMQDQLENARDRLADYKSETQGIAFPSSLALGIAVSALGIRSLELFVDPAVFAGLSSAQRGAFNATDVVLTGALLGGGSEGLHKVISVFTNFMDTTAKRAKGGTE